MSSELLNILWIIDTVKPLYTGHFWSLISCPPIGGVRYSKCSAAESLKFVPKKTFSVLRGPSEEVYCIIIIIIKDKSIYHYFILFY